MSKVTNFSVVYMMHGSILAETSSDGLMPPVPRVGDHVQFGIDTVADVKVVKVKWTLLTGSILITIQLDYA